MIIHITKLPSKLMNDTSKGFRKKSVRLRTAKGRKNSSQIWLQRQLNDPYVQKAQLLGYRSRAAFKLEEIQKKFNIINNNSVVVDLGSTPGGWSQLIARYTLVDKQNSKKTQIFAVDLLDMQPISGIHFIKGDFLQQETIEKLVVITNNCVTVVLSDMAASTTGHVQTDHIKTNILAENAFIFTQKVLSDGGTFVCKVFDGGLHQELLIKLQKSFAYIKHFKPQASRKSSPETYMVCKGFKRGTIETNDVK